MPSTFLHMEDTAVEKDKNLSLIEIDLLGENRY
jgi:hypothetical protein